VVRLLCPTPLFRRPSLFNSTASVSCLPLLASTPLFDGSDSGLTVRCPIAPYAVRSAYTSTVRLRCFGPLFCSFVSMFLRLCCFMLSVESAPHSLFEAVFLLKSLLLHILHSPYCLSSCPSSISTSGSNPERLQKSRFGCRTGSSLSLFVAAIL
jgi:hypothetical protein